MEDGTYKKISLVPTRYIQVIGPENFINPDSFLWAPKGLESAVEEKERLREIIKQTFPSLDNVRRHYASFYADWFYPLTTPRPLSR